MKLLCVQINHFMAISEARLELADRGLVLVQGENTDESSADSNGSGKSSIFDAICWCLYGTTARGETGDNIVNRTAGKNCLVACIVQDGDDTYTITRHRKHKTGKNSLTVWIDDVKTGARDLSKGTEKLTQAVVDQIIGCSPEVFCGAVYAGQEKMPDLPGMTDKQLKMLIEEASGATILEAAYKEANDRVNKLKKVQETISFIAIGNDREIASAKEMLAETHERSKQFESKRITAVKSLHEEGIILKGNIESTERAIATAGKAIIESKIEALDATIFGVKREQETDRKNVEVFDRASRDYSAAGIACKTAEKTVERVKKELDELDHKVGCPCRTCNRDFTEDDIEPSKKLAAAELATCESELDAARESLELALFAFKNAADARDKYRRTMTDVSAASAERASLQKRLHGIDTLEATLASYKRDLAMTVKQIKTKRDEPNPFVDQAAKLDAKLGAFTHQAVKLASDLDGAVKAVQIAEHVAKVFSPTGVRAFLLDEVTPFLNDQTAKYLGTLSDGHISATWTTLVKTAKGELKEKFSIEVDNENGGGTFGLISGGEKRKVRIACALALQDLVARRASKPIELFIGDEIDDALDDAGRERLMTILEEKARERGSVFVISHSDLKDWIRQSITVKKVGGKATIEEALV